MRGDEPEAVHDLRLALRRTRCLLGPLRGVFTRAETARLRTGLRWLGELSGPPRDLELLIERLEASREKLPEEDRGAIEALLSLVGRDRDQARRALLKGLSSARYGRLGDAWARLASSFVRPTRENGSAGLPRPRPSVPAADQPIATVAAEAIDRAWRRLLRHGKKLSDSSAAEDFHEVRIDGKKLRYLLELFRSVYPAVDLGPTIENLKSLQNCLGDLNDAQVQEDLLRTHRATLGHRRRRRNGRIVGAGRSLDRTVQPGPQVGAASIRRPVRHARGQGQPPPHPLTLGPLIRSSPRAPAPGGAVRSPAARRERASQNRARF